MRSFCSASVSKIPAGSASGTACRIVSGTVSEINSSISDTPITESISRMSGGDGPICRREKLLGSKSAVRVNIILAFARLGFVAVNVSRDHRLIGLLIEQAVELGQIKNLDFEEPTLTHRIAVHQRRVIDNGLIDLGDFAALRRINLRGSLDGLDDRGWCSLFGSCSRSRQLDKDQVAELVLRVGRDAHRGDVAFNTQPFVVFCELQHCDWVSAVQLRL